jgi:serine/threonine protein kinase
MEETEENKSAPERNPTSIGDYEIIEFLGVGTFGMAYSAKKKGEEKLVCLKLFISNEKSSDFLKECEVGLMQIDHPNIIKFFGCGKG